MTFLLPRDRPTQDLSIFEMAPSGKINFCAHKKAHSGMAAHLLSRRIDDRADTTLFIYIKSAVEFLSFEFSNNVFHLMYQGDVFFLVTRNVWENGARSS